MSHHPERVLVTGAGGFIGAHLVRDQLQRGRAVVAVDLNLDALQGMDCEPDLTRAEIDIRSTAELAPLLSNVDTVFHLAAAHLDVHQDADHFEAVNVRATEALVRLAASHGATRFVHCSTVGVYGPLPHLPADEQTKALPEIDYERTKLAGEDRVRRAGAESAMAIVIVRPAWVYGPGCPRTLKLIQSIARRRFICVGNGSNLRHPLYVADALEAFERAASCPKAVSETLLIAGPEPLSVQELSILIADELGVRFRPPRVPLWLMSGVCLAVEKTSALARVEPPFSRRSLKFFTESSAFDTSRSRRLLDFQPKVSNRDGIRMTIAHYRASGAL